MSKSLLLGAAHLLTLACGFAAAAWLTAAAAARIPHAASRCVVVNSACWSANSFSMNDKAKPDGLRADKACHLSNMLNFVWCNEYSGDHIPVFASLGHTGPLEAHLLAIYQIAAMPGVRSILYFNAPGGLTSFTSHEDLLAAIAAAERIRNEYPETAPDVAVYLQRLTESDGYRKALEAYGPNWRLRLQDDLRLAPATERLLAFRLRKLESELLRPIREMRHPMSIIKRTFLEWHARRQCRTRGLSGKLPSGLRVVKLLDECSARYSDPENDKSFFPMIGRKRIWMRCGGQDTWTAWANIVAKICKAKGIRLVFYIPPHLQVSDEQYRSVFLPEFTDRIRKSFALAENVIVIDHAMDRHLNPWDMIWFRGRKSDHRVGYLTNVIGRLKLARLLLRTLNDSGVDFGDDRPGEYLASAWTGEKQLATAPRAIRVLSLDHPAVKESDLLTEEAMRREREIR